MCGLFGAVDSNREINLARARQALVELQYRGPDGTGEWLDSGVYIGHRRLSILDLSPAGAQPMSSDSVVITVNGEIYNFRELRRELEQNFSFRSGSDSEVVLYGYRQWGLRKLTEKLDGMYAIAIFDKQARQVHLLRDRVGIKPLYYAADSNSLAWSSELAPLAGYLGLGASDVLPESILDFSTYRCIPAPKTFYCQVAKLPAASWATFALDSGRLDIQRYWAPNTTPSTLDAGAIRETVEHLITTSVAQHMVSDVPVGCFLSGGIDSGLLAAMLARSGHKLPTFSIGFDDKRFDESALISQVATHLGLANRMQQLDQSGAAAAFANLRHWYGEPFADFSFMPTNALCQLTSQSITVALSGDGADELFGGYPRYLHMLAAGAERDGSPGVAHLLGWLKGKWGWSLSGRLVRLLEARALLSGNALYCYLNGGLLANETLPLARHLGIADDYDRYWLYSQFDDKKLSGTAHWRYIDLLTLLPDMLLSKIDRLSMRYSLEVRVPYLSKELVEFAFTLPDCVLYQGGISKSVLRDIAADYLPHAIVSAPKRGFGTPAQLRLSASGKRCSPQHKVLSEAYGELGLAELIK